MISSVLLSVVRSVFKLTSSRSHCRLAPYLLSQPGGGFKHVDNKVPIKSPIFVLLDEYDHDWPSLVNSDLGAVVREDAKVREPST